MEMLTPWLVRCTGVIDMIETMTAWLRAIVAIANSSAPGPRTIPSSAAGAGATTTPRASTRGSGRSATT